eukprot:2216408-Pyramimonas_sp.AAC.2
MEGHSLIPAAGQWDTKLQLRGLGMKVCEMKQTPWARVSFASSCQAIRTLSHVPSGLVAPLSYCSSDEACIYRIGRGSRGEVPCCSELY